MANKESIETYRKFIQAQSYGDSILLPYEFLSKKIAKKRLVKHGYQQSLKKNFGITSDDTDHLIMTYQSLICSDNDNLLFNKNLKKKLRKWIFTMPFGIGRATLISSLKSFLGFNITGINSAGNGPLMRIPAISVYYAKDTDLRNKFTIISTQLTHNNQIAYATTLGISNFISFIHNEKKLPTIEELKTILLNKSHTHEEWDNYVDFLLKNINNNLEDFLIGINCSKFVSGYIIHSSIFALYLLYNTQNFKEAYYKVIEASGDTDSIGALLSSCFYLLGDNEVLESSNILPNYSKDILEGSGFWKTIIYKNIYGFSLVLLEVAWRMKERVMNLFK